MIDPLSVACPHCLSLAGEPCVLVHIGAGQPHHTPHEAREERARAVVQAATTEPPPPPVPPEYEAIARALEDHAAALRDLGRYGPRALGEGEDPVDALWDLATTLEGKAREVDSLAHALEVEISARLLAREGTA